MAEEIRRRNLQAQIDVMARVGFEDIKLNNDKQILISSGGDNPKFEVIECRNRIEKLFKTLIYKFFEGKTVYTYNGLKRKSVKVIGSSVSIMEKIIKDLDRHKNLDPQKKKEYLKQIVDAIHPKKDLFGVSNLFLFEYSKKMNESNKELEKLELMKDKIRVMIFGDSGVKSLEGLSTASTETQPIMEALNEVARLANSIKIHEGMDPTAVFELLKAEKKFGENKELLMKTCEIFFPDAVAELKVTYSLIEKKMAQVVGRIQDSRKNDEIDLEDQEKAIKALEKTIEHLSQKLPEKESKFNESLAEVAKHKTKSLKLYVKNRGDTSEDIQFIQDLVRFQKGKKVKSREYDLAEGSVEFKKGEHAEIFGSPVASSVVSSYRSNIDRTLSEIRTKDHLLFVTIYELTDLGDKNQWFKELKEIKENIAKQIKACGFYIGQNTISDSFTGIEVASDKIERTENSLVKEDVVKAFKELQEELKGTSPQTNPKGHNRLAAFAVYQDELVELIEKRDALIVKLEKIEQLEIKKNAYSNLAEKNAFQRNTLPELQPIFETLSVACRDAGELLSDREKLTEHQFELRRVEGFKARLKVRVANWEKVEQFIKDEH